MRTRTRTAEGWRKMKKKISSHALVSPKAGFFGKFPTSTQSFSYGRLPSPHPSPPPPTHNRIGGIGGTTVQSMQVQGQSEMEVWVRKFTRHFEAHRLQPERGLTLGITGVLSEFFKKLKLYEPLFARLYSTVYVPLSCVSVELDTTHRTWQIGGYVMLWQRMSRIFYEW